MKAWAFIIAVGLCLAMIGNCSAQSQQQGIVLDATTRHVIGTGGISSTNLSTGDREPRLLFQLLRHQALANSPQAASTAHGVVDAASNSSPQAPPPSGTVPVQGVTTQNTQNRKIDWSVPLGSANLAPHQWPAKYNLDPNAQPDCVNDYVVFGLNVAGVTNGQANLVGINELYSGTNPTGYCGTTPHVNWAYNGSTAGGAILGSTTLSLDGTKIAYIESTSTSAILHVLTWKAGQGTSATASAKPTLVGNCTTSTSCLKSLTYSTSSAVSGPGATPWVDYGSDKGFVVTDSGMLFRISCVFTCALNSNPTIDWSFKLPVAGTGGASPGPTMPVFDPDSGRVFIADQLGEIWVVNGSGSTPSLLSGPVMIGGGGCTTANPPGRTGTPSPCTAKGGSFGIPDGVIEDVVGLKIFVVSGNDGTAGRSAVVVQMNEDLTGQVRDRIGLGSVSNTTTNANLYFGDFDNNFYFGTPTQGHLFLCGTGTLNTQPWDYWLGFTGYPVMNSTVTLAASANIPVAGAACTAFTEFYNPNVSTPGHPNDHDLLMGGVIDPTNGVLILDDISNGNILIDAPNTPMFVFYPGGISNIVVDNTASPTGFPQANSMYFSTLGVVSVGTCSNARCAVKLSQLNLQ